MDRVLLNELKEFLAERMVDNMTTEQLAEYVQDDLFTYFDKQGEHDFLEEANNYWGEHLGEVIDEIQDYIKCDFKKQRSGWPIVNNCFNMLIYPLNGHIILYNKRVQTKFIHF